MAAAHSAFAAAAVLAVGVVLAPLATTPAADPQLAETLDATLRVPFAATALRAPAARLHPGERILAVRLPGDPGVFAPRDGDALQRALAGLPAGSAVEVEVRGPDGARSVSLVVAAATLPGHALARQWPTLLATAGLLLFALACAFGGRHPIVTPLFVVSLSLAAGIGSALALAGPGASAGGLATLRARVGVLAWCVLPAALVHLAARFPVVAPRLRHPALLALPYGLWAVPALVAQLRFDAPAAVDAVERVALAASFVAGAILIAACCFPARPLSPVERARARAATLAFLAAGIGPLAVFVRGVRPGPLAAQCLSLGVLALPLALGWTVVRFRLLDAPPPLLAAIGSGGAVLVGLAATAALAAPAWSALAGAAAQPADAVAGLAIASALVFQAARAGALRLSGAPGVVRRQAAAVLARASRELAAAPGRTAVVERLLRIVRETYRPSALEFVGLDSPEPLTPLAREGRALWLARATDESRALLRAPRSEDPHPARPELVVALEPRNDAPLLLVMAARCDGLPYAPEELRALEDVARLASLALGDATAAQRLEALVAARTQRLTRALADREAVLAAASGIQSAADVGAIRVAVAHFLERCTGQRPRARSAADHGRDALGVALAVTPSRVERLELRPLEATRRADLAPQLETVGALANLALERLHLLAGLKLEVGRQARELARASTGRHNEVFVRRTAHELRKPGEEIRQLAEALEATATPAQRALLGRIQAVSHELARRLDCLLVYGGRRLDLRRVDLVRSVDEAALRFRRLRADRRLEVVHARARLPLVADPVRIGSVLENLLDNAAKATQPGGRVVVRTELQRGDDDAPRALLEVEDDGPGVPPALGASIFEPGVGGFRNGFGLGLALCRETVSAHGGAISVESQRGRTRFRVRLPQLGPDAMEGGSP